MMRPAIALLLMLPLLLAQSGCAASRAGGQALPRISGGTIGLVVFGQADAPIVAERSARYIVEPGGLLRASFGAGSTALTFPPIVRRLNERQLREVWALVEALEPRGEPWHRVPAPELFHSEGESARVYLLELGDASHSRAWSVSIDHPPARHLAERLASLAWVSR